jgi:hypothetical protein
MKNELCVRVWGVAVQAAITFSSHETFGSGLRSCRMTLAVNRIKFQKAIRWREWFEVGFRALQTGIE